MTLGDVHRKGYRAARRWQRRLSGLRYALRVLIAGAIVWFVLAVLAHADPLWGLISAVVVTDLEMRSAMTNFVSRMLNTLIGCATGLAFLWLFGAAPWSVLLAMALAVVISSDLVRVPISWRIAPITTAIVMIPAYLAHSAHAGLAASLERTGDVVLGSAVAVAVSTVADGWLRLRRQGRG